MIKGFFFDLDGTLVDTHEANFQAYKRALADTGVAITFEAFKRTIGMQAKDFLPLLAPGITQADITQVAVSKAAYYKDLVHLSKRNEALIDFIRYTKANHVIALVTTAKRVNAEAVLAQHGLTDHFTIIITADDVTQGKPSPEGYEQALAQSGLLPNEAIAFEDSSTGQQAAEAAGIQVVLIKDFSA